MTTKRIRGIRDPIPGNTVVGRLGTSLGDAGPITIKELLTTSEATSVIVGQEPKSANPTATAGPAAVDGAAPTFMTSDSAPAVQIATTGQLGLVQPDGTTITISSGVISAIGSAGTLPLVNGDTPGPALMADTDGQCIAVPL